MFLRDLFFVMFHLGSRLAQDTPWRTSFDCTMHSKGMEVLGSGDTPFPTSGRVYRRQSGGNCHLDFPIDQVFPQLLHSIKQGVRLVQLDALPNSGKTKRLPASLVECGYEVLVLTPQVADLADLHARLSASVPCRVSAGQHFYLPSTRPGRPRVHVLSVGLGALWVHGSGDWTAWCRRFGVVLCDEAHFMQTNFVYGHLVTELMQLVPRATFVLMSGTLPTSLGEKQVDQVRIACGSRKHSLDCYDVVVADKEAEALALVSFFLQMARPVILFVAGKQEIADAKTALLQRGVPLAALEAVHGDMTAKEIEKRTQSGGVKAYICTNVGETSLTIPGAVVISTNQQRLITHEDGVVHIHDSVPTEAARIQRENRSGRTEAGIAITLGEPGESRAPTLDMDTTMRVLCWTGGGPNNAFQALEPASLELSLRRIKQLFPSPEVAREAASLPFPLELGAIFLAGRQRGVGRALAALLFALDNGVCKQRADTMQIIETVQARVRTPAGTEAASMTKAREMYAHFVDDRRLPYDQVEDPKAVALEVARAFLSVRPSALCMCDGARMWHAGHCMDSPSSDLAVVGVHFQLLRGTMRCLLHVPAPPEALLRASVSLSSDSTFGRFKGVFCDTARAEGYHARDIRIVPGAEEAEVAQEALTFTKATVAVHVQNGNGLAKFKEDCADARAYIDHAASCTAATLKLTAERAIVFVGRCELSPGVRHLHTYGVLTKLYTSKLREKGVAVFTDAQVCIAEDGIHWDYLGSTAGVAQLTRTLLHAAESVELIQAVQPLPWCLLRGEDGYHHPICRGCWKRIDAKHMESMRHHFLHSCIPCSAFPPSPQPQRLFATDNSAELRPHVELHLSAAGVAIPRFPPLRALPAMLTLESSPALALAEFAVRTAKHARRGWWVGIDVTKIQAGMEKIDVVGHMTVGYVPSQALASVLKQDLTNTVDLRKAPFRVSCNRKCWPRYAGDSFMLDVLYPAQDTEGLRDAVRTAWVSVGSMQTFKSNLHISLEANALGGKKVPADTADFAPGTKVAVKWYGQLHLGTIRDERCEHGHLTVLWDSERSKSVVPVADVMRYTQAHALASFDAAAYGAEYLPLRQGDSLALVESSTTGEGWSFALHMSQDTSGWVPRAYVVPLTEV